MQKQSATKKVSPWKHHNSKSKLPPDFKPRPYSVIIGRGKTISNTEGNQHLRTLAISHLKQYTAAQTKADKTKIVSRIVNITKEAVGGLGAFVKFQDGCWWEINDALAKDKVGHVLRDLLHEKYKSSSKSKVERRRMMRKNEQNSCASSEIDSRASLTEGSVTAEEETKAAGIIGGDHSSYTQEEKLNDDDPVHDNDFRFLFN